MTDYLFTNLSQPFVVFLILLVWFQTEAFYEYCRLFRFKKLFKIEDYSNVSEISGGSSYIEFLNINHDSFFTRLISCPVCLGFWLNVIYSFSFYDFSFFFVKMWFTFLLYFVIVLLMKKSI